MYICELCREEVDPDAPDIVRAIERKRTWAFGGVDEYIDGHGVFFHQRHYPGGNRYRLAEPDER